MAILQGTMQDGTVLPVQVDSQGRLVAEGLPGPQGPQGPAGPVGSIPGGAAEGDVLTFRNGVAVWATPLGAEHEGEPGPITWVGTQTHAQNGVYPNGGNPYWIDILPPDSLMDSNNTGLNKTHDGDLVTGAYWSNSVGTGQVIEATLDLRAFVYVWKVVVTCYGYGVGSYRVTPLDRDKNAIGSVQNLANTGQISTVVSWKGRLRYLKFTQAATGGCRNTINAVTVNDKVLVNGLIPN